MTGGRMTAPSRQRPAAPARRHPRLDAIDVAALFDRNADWYDRVNTVMTLGLDAGWRRWAAREAVAGAVRVAANSAAATDGALPRLPHVLDACAGTGQVALELARRGADVTVVDFSECMLARARRRFAAADLPLVTVAADLTTPAGLAAAAAGRPAGDSGAALAGRFDAVTLGFGVRYMTDPGALLAHLHDLIVPRGTIVVLESVRPGHDLAGLFAGTYFFQCVPYIGTLLAGRGELFHYLTESTRALGSGDDLAALLRAAGFTIVRQRRFAAGVVVGLVAQAR
jgi:demethylmenaquinone methyltransferase/2-methoxy-6-polyprenyl-1,4-benzoquinol methylase